MQERWKNFNNYPCKPMTLEQKEKWLKERDKSVEKIYKIVACVQCGVSFIRLIIDANRKICYDC